MSSFNNNTKDKRRRLCCCHSCGVNAKIMKKFKVRLNNIFGLSDKCLTQKRSIFFLKEKLIHFRQLFKHTTNLCYHISLLRDSHYFIRESSDRERDIFDSLILSFFVKRHTYCSRVILSLCAQLLYNLRVSDKKSSIHQNHHHGQS